MDTLCVTDRREWRNWLHKNAAKYEDIWLVYYKEASGQSGISYEDSVEEAVCFGWIDGKIQKLHELRYARRFTPRKPNSRWSASNIRRVEGIPNQPAKIPGFPASQPSTGLFMRFSVKKGA